MYKLISAYTVSVFKFKSLAELNSLYQANNALDGKVFAETFNEVSKTLIFSQNRDEKKRALRILIFLSQRRQYVLFVSFFREVSRVDSSSVDLSKIPNSHKKWVRFVFDLPKRSNILKALAQAVSGFILELESDVNEVVKPGLKWLEKHGSDYQPDIIFYLRLHTKWFNSANVNSFEIVGVATGNISKQSSIPFTPELRSILKDVFRTQNRINAHLLGAVPEAMKFELLVDTVREFDFRRHNPDFLLKSLVGMLSTIKADQLNEESRAVLRSFSQKAIVTHMKPTQSASIQILSKVGNLVSELVQGLKEVELLGSDRDVMRQSVFLDLLTEALSDPNQKISLSDLGLNTILKTLSKSKGNVNKRAVAKKAEILLKRVNAF